MAVVELQNCKFPLNEKKYYMNQLPQNIMRNTKAKVKDLNI